MSNDIFGLSEKAIKLCEERSVLLSNNVVNAATPHYKARDIDFQKVLRDEQTNLSSSVKNELPTSSNVMYRVPMQKNMDGNTVDEEVERKNFIENAIRYQVNLTFVENKSDQLIRAIKGE